MGKSKNSLTPQELYRAKKQKEEAERDAYLPPGLINHGNTCFMNSVLQGLIATQPLAALAHFQVPPLSHQSFIVPQRSPQLTNGHGFGGEFEREWEDGMPLGDVFLKVMERAWSIERDRSRQNLSPKEILTSLGRKYDQYLDFRQQDAHELYCHLLDAMRMEELDIIKKRQPPPPKRQKKSRKQAAQRAQTITQTLIPDSDPVTSTPVVSPHAEDEESQVPGIAEISSTATEIPPSERLVPFVDMIFTGQLASILVCEKCKHVSHTYEDFSDLSLSIKPEDYLHDRERKRDKLKSLAQRLRKRSVPRISMPEPMLRASSVPPSPTRRSGELAHEQHEPPVNEEARRRSVDTPGEGGGSSGLRTSVASTSGVTKVQIIFGDASPEDVEEKEDDDVVFETAFPGKTKDGEDGGGWNKLGRRISARVGKAMEGRGRTRAKADLHEPSLGKAQLDHSSPQLPSDSLSKATNGILEMTAAYPDQPINQPDSFTAIEKSSKSTPISRAPSSSSVTSLTLPPALIPPLVAPPAHSVSFPLLGKIDKDKSRLPKLTVEESAYLRRILADASPVSTSPFSIFRTNTPPSTYSLWNRLAPTLGVEECLRMFTAVEVLDGDNMVGCRRCWKMANGQYRPRAEKRKAKASRGESDEDEADVDVGVVVTDITERGHHVRMPATSGRENIVPSSPYLSGVDTPASSVVSDSGSPFFQSLNNSATSIPTTLQSDVVEIALRLPHPSVSDGGSTSSLPRQQVAIYGGQLIPSISTTGPDVQNTEYIPDISSPKLNGPFSSSSSAQPDHSNSARIPRPVPPTSSKSTLLAPRPGHRKQFEVEPDDDLSESSSSSSEESSEDYEASEVSGHSGVSSAASATPSQDRSTPSSDTPNTSLSVAQKVPKSKQVIPRRAYKRYLISSPPPVLVIHLKRFQQISKMPVMSFSSGFRKLDDFVAFPEYLDMAPFLAPKRADFLQKKSEGKAKEAKKDPQTCVYRLYAVVVHIGNMLGGHYIAYTALPSPPTQVSTTPLKDATDAPMSDPIIVTPTPPVSRAISPERNIVESKASKPQRRWAYVSDTVVRLTTLEEVLKAKAYMCLYERL